MKKIILAVSALAALVASSLSSAAVIAQYDVSSTSALNCSGSPHGLWTHSVFSGSSCANFFDINGLFTQYDDGTASLIAMAQNPAGLTANVNISLGDFNATTGADGYKQEGGLAFDAANVDFYNSISGTIDVAGNTHDISFFRHTFQFGLGANAKSQTEFGGSAWVCPHADCSGPEHWDLNLTFTSVPEPSALALLAMGLIGFGASRKKK